jgi:RND family efflux transporter MFP subunit
VQVGDLVSSGTLVATLADLSNLRVRAMVDETEISQVEIGQDVVITFDAFPGQQFRGKVLEIPLQGELTQNILMYEVPVSLEGAEEVSLKPGMTANLTAIVGRRQNVLLVPAMAVQRGEQGNFVRLDDATSKEPVYVPVELGLSDGVYVEVRRGLNEGDRILVEYTASQQQGGFSQGPVPMGGFAPFGGGSRGR